MNRRDFLGTVSTAIAGFSILPSATTYKRIWKQALLPPIAVYLDFSTLITSRGFDMVERLKYRRQKSTNAANPVVIQKNGLEAIMLPDLIKMEMVGPLVLTSSIPIKSIGQSV